MRPPVFQVVVQLPGSKPALFPVRAFPFVIGRAADSDAPVEAPGVWDRHLQLRLTREGGVQAEVYDGALASWGGEPFQQRTVRMGDRLTLGTAQVEVSLAPVRRRSLGAWELMALTILLGVAGAQLAAIWRLMGD